MSEHERVSDIFLRACDLPPEERDAFLERECGENAALRTEVEAMLIEDARPDGTVGMIGVVGAAAEAAARTPLSPSDRIGPYRILERLGEGGMGIVYRAEQEEPIRRMVALKVIRGAFHSDVARARFHSERQALALLDHPGIARVLDAGSTQDGQPYFAMELVHGEPIEIYCRARSLDVTTRVLLFRDVCRAIRHAHRRGIIHRDLKPSNVLVTEFGGRPVPKVIDFSIAKVLEDTQSPAALRTRTGQMIGTLEYMSPEQARGEIARIDTRSDVYSLGVLLFELLAGRLPYDVSDLSIPDAVRRITAQPPEKIRPSTTGRLDADLETIVAKCLEKDPDRRYSSAAELVEDLDRFMEHRPILARPPSTFYQARKLVGRHRVATGVAALVVTFLVTLSVTMTIQFGIQRRERLRAEAETEKARQVTSFLTGMLASANPYEGSKDMTVREVVEKAAREAGTELADQPEVLGEVEFTIGVSFMGLGFPQEALSHFENALELKTEVFGEEHLEVARAYTRLAGCLAQLGRNPESEPHVERALAIQRKLQPGSADLGRSLMQLSDIRFGQNRLEEAGQLAEEAIAIDRRLPEDDAFTYALMSNGVILTAIGKFDDADRLLKEAADVQKRIAGDRHPLYLAVLAEMAINLEHQGRSEEAIRLHRDVLRGRLDALGKEHPLVALTRNNLAVALLNEGRCREAEPEFEEILRIWRARFGETHPSVAVAWRNRGMMLQCLGDYSGAREAYERELSIHEERMAIEKSPEYKNTLRLLGTVSARLGDLGTSEKWIRKALEEFEKGGALESASGALPQYDMGVALLEQDRPQEAEAYLRNAVRQIEDPESVPIYFMYLNALGRCLVALGRTEEGEALMEEARPSLTEKIFYLDASRYEIEKTLEYFGPGGDPAVVDAYRSGLDMLARIREGEPVIP